jgi:hypothetical protein
MQLATTRGRGGVSMLSRCFVCCVCVAWVVVPWLARSTLLLRLWILSGCQVAVFPGASGQFCDDVLIVCLKIIPFLK